MVGNARAKDKGVRRVPTAPLSFDMSDIVKNILNACKVSSGGISRAIYDEFADDCE